MYRKCRDTCPDIVTETAKSVCESKIPVVKALRICNFEILKPLIDEGINLRILMLSRDPRGIFNSRRHIFTDWSLEKRVENLKWTCRQTLKNMEDLDKFPWLKEMGFLILIYDFSRIRYFLFYRILFLIFR